MSEQEQRLPDVAEVLVSTAASLVNLAGIRLTEKEHRNLAQAKEAIDAVRGLIPLCPEQAVDPIKDALSQVQMLYVREQQGGSQPAEPAEPGTGAETAERTEEAERAKARSKIWTPPGA